VNSSNFFDQIIRYLSFPFKDRELGKKIAISFALTLSATIVPIVPTLLIR